MSTSRYVIVPILYLLLGVVLYVHLGTSLPVPYAIVGDEAFPLRMNLLRPYPGRNIPGTYIGIGQPTCINLVLM